MGRSIRQTAGGLPFQDGVRGFTFNVRPIRSTITPLPPACKGTSPTARHSSPLNNTRPSVLSHCFISTTFPIIPVTLKADFLFLSLKYQMSGNTTCSMNSKARKAMMNVIMMLFKFDFLRLPSGDRSQTEKSCKSHTTPKIRRLPIDPGISFFL
jgi:hypothetical protein